MVKEQRRSNLGCTRYLGFEGVQVVRAVTSKVERIYLRGYLQKQTLGLGKKILGIPYQASPVFDTEIKISYTRAVLREGSSIPQKGLIVTHTLIHFPSITAYYMCPSAQIQCLCNLIQLKPDKTDNWFYKETLFDSSGLYSFYSHLVQSTQLCTRIGLCNLSSKTDVLAVFSENRLRKPRGFHLE